jgi:hypothetical protein
VRQRLNRLGSLALGANRFAPVREQPLSETKNKQTKNKRKVMNDKFDELAKGLAQSVTRRGAMKKFGVGLAGIALASLGLVNKAEGDPKPCLPSGSFCPSRSSCENKCCSGIAQRVSIDGKFGWVCY